MLFWNQPLRRRIIDVVPPLAVTVSGKITLDSHLEGRSQRTLWVWYTSVASQLPWRGGICSPYPRYMSSIARRSVWPEPCTVHRLYDKAYSSAGEPVARQSFEWTSPESFRCWYMRLLSRRPLEDPAVLAQSNRVGLLDRILRLPRILIVSGVVTVLSDISQSQTTEASTRHRRQPQAGFPGLHANTATTLAAARRIGV